MFTFKDYMLAEAEGKDPAEEMAQKQDKLVSLVTDIRKIMSSLSMVEPEEAAKDPLSFSFVDLIEALNTTEEVIRDRLSTEGVKMDSGKTVSAQGKEWKGDEKNEYDRLFTSIGDQVKDTIKNLFTIPRGEGQKSTLPRFVNSYNQLVVDKLIEALKLMGPLEANNAVGGIIEAAKKAVINQEVTGGKETSAEAKQVLTKYRQARKQTIGKKHSSARTKRDRLKLIKAVATAVQDRA